MSPEEALKHFKEEVPTLGLLGSSHLIDSTCDYSIDDDVQLVCKYLKAYESKKINTLYKEGIVFKHKFNMVTARFLSVYTGGSLVKFSNQPEISTEECKALLQKYMPQHIKENKITQKVFVK